MYGTGYVIIITGTWYGTIIRVHIPYELYSILGFRMQFTCVVVTFPPGVLNEVGVGKGGCSAPAPPGPACPPCRFPMSPHPAWLSAAATSAGLTGSVPMFMPAIPASGFAPDWVPPWLLDRPSAWMLGISIDARPPGPPGGVHLISQNFCNQVLNTTFHQWPSNLPCSASGSSSHAHASSSRRSVRPRLSKAVLSASSASKSSCALSVSPLRHRVVSSRGRLSPHSSHATHATHSAHSAHRTHSGPPCGPGRVSLGSSVRHVHRHTLYYVVFSAQTL